MSFTNREKTSADAMITPCNCIGPQNGEPLCPCRMRGVVVKNGRYVMPEQDLGPVIPSGHADCRWYCGKGCIAEPY